MSFLKFFRRLYLLSNTKRTGLKVWFSQRKMNRCNSVSCDERCESVTSFRVFFCDMAYNEAKNQPMSIIRCQLTIEWLVLLLLLQFGDRVIEAIWWTPSFRWHKQQVTSGIVYNKRCPTVYVTGWQSISVNSCVFNHGCSHRSTVHSEN